MKKKRTREEGLSLARAYRGSGLTLRKFCKRNDVTECSVQYWAQKLRDEATSTSLVADATFVEVKPKEVSSKEGAAKVKVGVAEVSFLSLPNASWMSEFVVTVNRYS